MNRVTSGDISYLVSGKLQGRSNVDLTKLTGPFDRTSPGAPNPKADPIFGIGGPEVMFSLGPQEFIGFELLVPKDYAAGKHVYQLSNVTGQANLTGGNHSLDVAYSTILGDFTQLDKLVGVGVIYPYITTENPTAFYLDATPGSHHFINIRLHAPEASTGPLKFILGWKGGAT